MGNFDHDLLKASFFGPWMPVPGTKRRSRFHHMSLAHWYESAKFMPAHPDLRDGVSFCPTVKEARKFSKTRQDKWRSDWNMVRHHVLIAGLGFLSLDRPDLNLASWPKEQLVAQLANMKLPERFLSACIDGFKTWAAGPRIGTYGAQHAPDGVVGRKMSKVVQNQPVWTLVALCNNKAAWRVHDWALSLYVPVQYIGDPTSRASTGLMDQLVKSCNQLVVFEAKGGRCADGVIQRGRAAKVSLTLELYQPEDLATQSLG